jgi:hypothetical protein
MRIQSTPLAWFNTVALNRFDLLQSTAYPPLAEMSGFQVSRSLGGYYLFWDLRSLGKHYLFLDQQLFEPLSEWNGLLDVEMGMFQLSEDSH